MSKSEKRAQTFLYIGVLLALIAADWHWYLGEFAICLAASGVFFWKLRKQEAAYTRKNKRGHEKKRRA